MSNVVGEVRPVLAVRLHNRHEFEAPIRTLFSAAERQIGGVGGVSAEHLRLLVLTAFEFISDYDVTADPVRATRRRWRC